MKANPFLSSEDIFAKAPRKISLQEQPTRSEYAGYSTGGLPSNLQVNPKAPHHNQSSQLSLGTRLDSYAMVSPLSANISDPHSTTNKEYSFYSQQQIHSHARADTRINNNYESTGYGSSMYREADNFYTETRERAVTLNFGSGGVSASNADTSKLHEASVYSLPQHNQAGLFSKPGIAVRTPPQFDDSGDFPDLNMSALAACLSNEQNRDQICKLIGLPSVSPQSTLIQPPPNQQHSYKPPIQPNYEAELLNGYAVQQKAQQVQHQQLLQPTNYAPQPQANAFAKKISQQEPRIPAQNQLPVHMQQAQPCYQQPLQQSAQPAQQQFAVSPLQSLDNRVQLPHAQPDPLKTRQPQIVFEQKRCREEMSINYQSDEEEEQFDFNENRDEDGHDPHQPSRRPTHLNSAHVVTSYCQIKLQPNTDPFRSLRESLSRQMEECTTRNGMRTFLTSGQQFQLRRYALT